VNTRPGTSISL